MKITSPEMLAHALKNARKQRDLTQQEIADHIGIKQATVSGFESRPDKSRIETLFKLLSALDLELRLSKRGAADNQAGWDQEW